MSTKGCSPVSKAAKEPPMLHLEFPPKMDVPGLEAAAFNQEVTVIVKGNVKAISESSWDKTRNLSVEIKSCEISVPAPATIDSALKKAERRA